MTYRLLCLGRQAQDPLLAATEAYASRLRRYVPFDLVRLRPAAKITPTAQLLGRIEPRDHVVRLDEAGRAVTTLALARTVADWARRARRQITFVVGGASGLDARMASRANDAWSLSPLTLPHRMAQVLLVEQLYRAHSILAGAPYHRG